MNHIYKVIWNKAKNCYTVVSEIAKSHSDSTKRVRVGTTAALMAAAVLTGFAMPAQAAVSIGTDGTVKAEAADINALNNLLKNGVTTTTGGSVTVGGLTVKKNGEVSVNNSPDVVYGKNAKIIWDSNNTMGQISIGNNATAITGRGGQEEAFAYDGDYNHAAGAIAIGANTYARTGSIMIGSHVYKGNMGDVKNIDTDSFNTGSDGAYGFTVNSTTIGTNSFTRGNLATTIGDYNIQSGRSVGYGWRNAINYGAQNFGATVIGALNSNESQSDIVSSYFGTSTSGVANSIVGVANRVNSSNGTLVFGAGNEVTHSLSDIYGVGDTTSLKDAKKAQDALKNAVAESNAGGAVLAIGGANKADWARKSQLIGVGNTLTGASSAVSEYNMINGYKNEVTNATHTSIIGSNNKAKNIKSTIVMGDHNTLEDRENVISLGNNNTVKANNAVAIGNGTTVKAESGVAIGVGSVADRVADSEKGARGEFAPDTIPTGQESTWTSTKGAVSVGDTANNITRQITNVAAGNEDTDAVNVAQLRQVASQAERANQGWNLTTNGVAAAATNVAPGGSVDFSGDDNVSVSNKETKVTVALNKNINVNNVQTNALNAKYNLSVGTANENGIMPFFVNSTGDFYAAHNKFHVDKDGKVTATAGEIGNVVLQNGVYYGHSTLQDGSLLLTDDNGNHSYIDAKGAKLGKVTVAEDGKITGVAAGAITADSTDAVNGSQLHAVATEAGKHSKVVNGSNISVEETDVDGQKIYKVGLNDDILLGKLTGNNVSISGTNGTIETTGYIATKDRIIADKGAQLADITVSGNAISNGEAKVALDGVAGTAGMINGKGASLYMQDGTTVINNKVGIDQEGKITGVAAGKISADSTDAVNGSQLHEVATEAGKHSKVVNGSNITVEETDQDGQKTYKVGLNKDILLGDITGKNVSISGTMGTIETTGYIATKDRIIADKGAQLADITVSGNAISNGEAKVALDGVAGTAGMINGKGASLYMQDGTTVINNKVGIDQEGKITGVAAGEISATSKDAVNGSQLKQTNDKVDALDKRVTQNEADIAQNKADIAQNKADIAQNKADIAQNKADIAQNKADIAQNKAGIAQNKKDINKLDTRVTNVEELAKKHTTVAAGDNITVTEGTNKDGGKNYTVAMKKDITVDSVKAGDTTINTEGVRIGDTTSLKKDSLTIGGKTYVTDKGLNANDQKVTGVAAGEISSTSTDAVNGSQLFKTNQQVGKLGNRINKVGAGAAALAALHPLDFDPDDKWDIAAGYGNYNGENAAAIGAYYRPNEDTMFSVGGSFGNGENMVNAGVSLKLGQGNHVSTSKVAMAKEIKDLRKELEGLKSALLDVNAGKKLDTSKLQLFPDVPKNHWAYEYVSTLKGNGMLTGYPDGEFKGDRPMTRYEFATMLYKAMLEGATLSDKILKEFAPELERFTVDTVHQDKDGKPTVERVRTVKAEK